MKNQKFNDSLNISDNQGSIQIGAPYHQRNNSGKYGQKNQQ